MGLQNQKVILAVSIAVWSEDKILLVRRCREPNIGLWALPGGKIEFGETIQDAAVRELLEETHLKSVPQNTFQILELRSDAYHYVLHCVNSIATSGKATAGDDVDRTSWVPPSEIEATNTVPGLALTLYRSMNGPFLPFQEQLLTEL